MEKSTKKRVRNVVLGMTSVALVAGITASLTLAYLTDKDSVTNVFTGSDGIKAILIEPDWDGDTTGTNTIDTEVYTPATDEDGNPKKSENGDPVYLNTKTTSELVFGEDMADNYMPGDVIPKNPKVKNMNDEGGKKEYVMIKVTYMVDNAPVSKDDFNKYATFTVNSSAWTSAGVADDTFSEYYVYGTSTDNAGLLELDAQAETSALFDKVTIVEGLSFDDDGKLLFADGTDTGYTALPELDIELKAAVVSKTDGESVSSYVDVLKGLFA